MNTETKTLGFVELLERSAEVLEREAAGIKEAHTRNRRWDGERATEARADHDEMKALAKRLRQSAKYHQPNPHGGPAVVFDACANSIRAGDPIKSAMANYSLRWAK